MALADGMTALNSGASKRTVLIVDDDVATRELYRSVLEEEGHAVEVAGNGHEALARLSKTPTPHVVLLDCSMPGMSGEEFLAALDQRAPGVRRQTRIIGFSSFRDTDPFREDFRRAVDEYVEKPRDLDELIALAARLLAP